MYNWRALPLKTAAALAAGLPESSRTVRRRAGIRSYPQELLMAEIIDLLRWLKWTKTKDGHKGRNPPRSMVQFLTEPVERPKKVKQGFASVEAFEEAYRKFTGQS